VCVCVCVYVCVCVCVCVQGPCGRRLDNLIQSMKDTSRVLALSLYIPNCDKKGFFKRKQVCKGLLFLFLGPRAICLGFQTDPPPPGKTSNFPGKTISLAVQAVSRPQEGDLLVRGPVRSEDPRHQLRQRGPAVQRTGQQQQQQRMRVNGGPASF